MKIIQLFLVIVNVLAGGGSWAGYGSDYIPSAVCVESATAKVCLSQSKIVN